MRTYITCFVLLAVFFSACSSQNTQKLNETIVKANEELKAGADEFNKKFDAISDLNFSSLETGRQKVVDLINKKLKEVGELAAEMPGGEDFKNAFIEYYKFEKDIYETDYREICTMTGRDDAEKLSQIALKMQDKSKKEDILERNIHKEQESFAKKNGMKIQ